MVGYYRLNQLGFTLEAGAHILPRSSYEALDTANDLVRTAEATRDDILNEAQTAYDEERRRGYEDGLNEARIEALQMLLHESLELDKGLHAIERDLVRVVADSVRKIISNFDDNEIAEALVRAAMQQMRRERSAELRVSSHLYGYFRDRVNEIVSEYPEVQLLEISLDSGLAVDQIVLETSIGRVEINTTERLENVLSVIQSAHTKTGADALDALRATHAEPAT